MKVYVFGTRGFPLVQGGVEKHCEMLYPLIAEKAEVVVYRRKPYITLAKNTHYPSIRFIDLPSTRIKGFEALWHSFLATLHILTQPRGIVHIHNIGPSLFMPLLRLFKRKIVLTFHTANYEHDKWHFIARQFLKFCEKIALRNAHAIIFINRYRFEQFPDRIRQKSMYIPNGIHLPVVADATRHLAKWGLEGQKYILSVGRITPEKGFDILIKAFLGASTPYKLVIAGGTEAETGYYRHLTGLSDPDKIIFTGYVYGEALQQLYTHADLFVLSSVSEGFPFVLLEAMSYGLPLLVSDIPATRLVTLSPRCYFPVGDVAALTAKIIGFIERNDQQKPVSYDLSPFDWRLIAEQTLAIYEKVIPNV